MNVKELRKAYVTLGLDENATLTQARDAYLTWVCLLDHDRTPMFPDPDAIPDLMHHELDLAWHAIEHAHQHGVQFPRQARGCRQCGGTPAVQVTLQSVQPGGFRARTSTSSERLCRECGLEAGWRTQRANLKRGWWGVLAPFANLRAIGHNSTELTFLRRLEPADRRRPRAGGSPVAAARLRWYQRRDMSDRRGFALLTALAMIVLLFGVILPVGSGSGGPTAPVAASSSATAATTGTSSGATTAK